MKPLKMFFLLFMGSFLLAAQTSTDQYAVVISANTISKEELNQSLWTAVGTGDVSQVDSLVAKGANIHNISSDRKNLLFKAVERGDMEMVNKLISMQVNVNAKDINGHTPLYHAVMNNDAGMILTLLDEKANADEGLRYALEKDKTQVFEFFLNHAAKPEPVVSWAVKHRRADLVNQCLSVYQGDPDYALTEAVKQSHLDLMQSLVTNRIEPSALIEMVKTAAIDYRAGRNAGATALFTLNKPILDIAIIAMQYGADPNRHFLTVIDNDNLLMLNLLLMNDTSDKKRALTYAIDRNRTGAAILILDYVDDVNGDPFIGKAAGLGNLEIAGALLSKGADANAGMLNAVKSNHADLVQLLLSYGAGATQPQYLSIASANGNLSMVELLLTNGATAEHGMLSAVENGNLPVVKTLIDHGVNGGEEKYLVAAVEHAQPSIVVELLQYDPDLSYFNYKGQTLLHLAAENKDVLTGQLLIDAGLDTETTDRVGNTPLHLAAAKLNNISFCQLLVENGGDVNARNRDGKTVLEMTKGSRNKKYLKSLGAAKSKQLF